LEKEINEDREANLERVNMHLERLLYKANTDLSLLRHMAFHCKARNMSAKARIKSLKAKLRKKQGGERRKKRKIRLESWLRLY